jgi:hypothetical protein
MLCPPGVLDSRTTSEEVSTVAELPLSSLSPFYFLNSDSVLSNCSIRSKWFEYRRVCPGICLHGSKILYPYTRITKCLSGRMQNFKQVFFLSFFYQSGGF